MRFVLRALAGSVLLFVSVGVSAQWAEPPLTGSAQQMLPDRTKLSGMSGLAPELEAGLVDAQRNTSERKAVVHAEVWGVNLVEPQGAGEPQRNQAYLSYVLDRNAPVNTTEREYTFENLSPGEHSITVQLMSLDHQPIGANVVISLKVPK